MKNIERLSQYITKNGAKDMMIHTIPNSSNWIVAQKIEKDKWMLTLSNPMGNVTYNLGSVSDQEHIELWTMLTRLTVESRTAQIKQAEQLKEVIHNFKKNHKKYKNFIRINIGTKSI